MSKRVFPSLFLLALAIWGGWFGNPPSLLNVGERVLDLSNSFRIHTIADSLSILLSSQPASNAVVRYAPQQQSTAKSISGKVTTTYGVTVQNLTVQLLARAANGWALSATTTTNATGVYTFQPVDAGQYRLYFFDTTVPARVNSLFYANAFTLESATTLTVTTKSLKNINIKLTNTGRINGLVTDEEGQPIEGVNVLPYQFVAQVTGPGEWRVLTPTVESDAAGLYELTGLISQTYRLEFRVPGSAEQAAYLGEFYPNQPTLQQASDLKVGPNAILPNINAQLTARGNIRGVVTTEVGQPLSGIRLEAYRVDPNVDPNGDPNGVVTDALIASAQSDAQGIYRIAGLAAGNYRIKAVDANLPASYASVFYPNATTAGDGAVMTLLENQSLKAINFQLALGGRIQGRVVDIDDTAINSLRATAFVREMASGAWRSVREATTDANGEYTLCCLPIGTVRVGFRENWEMGDSSYAPEYYKNSDSIENATDSAILSGQVVAGVDAQMEPLSNIFGRVVDAQGKPIQGILVRPYILGEPSNGEKRWLPYSLSTHTDESGSYQLQRLPLGVYRFEYANDSAAPPEFVNEFYNNAYSLETAQELTVAKNHSNLIVLDVQLTRYGRLMGQLTGTDGSPLENVSVKVYRHIPRVTGVEKWEQMEELTTRSDTQGHYTVYGLTAGLYGLEFSDADQPYVTEFFKDAEVLDQSQTISVTALDTSVNDLNAVLWRKGGMEGRVSDLSGNGVSDILVSFYKQVAATNSYSNVLSVYSQAQGLYHTEQLPPGIYRILFRDGITDTMRYSGRAYPNALDLKQAQDVMVPEGKVVGGLDITLPPSARLEGVVTDQTGKPLPGIQAGVFAEDADLFSTVEQALGVDHTDEAGRYQLPVSASGDYKIGFFDPNPTPQYLYQFYPNTGYASFAQTLTVELGNNPPAINVQLASRQENSYPPVSVNDTYSLLRGERFDTATAHNTQGILANDGKDQAISDLAAVLVTPPLYGTLELKADGNFVYQHTGGAKSEDFFTYQAVDGIRTSSIATVTLTIRNTESETPTPPVVASPSPTTPSPATPSPTTPSPTTPMPTATALATVTATPIPASSSMQQKVFLPSVNR